jgi:hypothetical protein
VAIASVQFVGNPSITPVQLPLDKPSGGIGCEHCVMQVGGVPLQFPAVHVIKPQERQLVPTLQFITQVLPELRIAGPTGQPPADQKTMLYLDAKLMPLQGVGMKVGYGDNDPREHVNTSWPELSEKLVVAVRAQLDPDIKIDEQSPVLLPKGTTTVQGASIKMTESSQVAYKALLVSLYTLEGFVHCDDVAMVVMLAPLIAITPSRHVAYTTPLLVSLYTLEGFVHCDDVAMVVMLAPLIAITPPEIQAAYTTPLVVSLYTLEGYRHCVNVAMVVMVMPLIAITPPALQAAYTTPLIVSLYTL